MDLEHLYQDIILDHYKHPRGRVLLPDPAGESYQVNPTCGDEVTVQVSLDGDGNLVVGYEGQGCSISQASASVMSEMVVGTAPAHADEVRRAFLELMHSKGEAEPDEDVLGDGVAFVGVAKYPARIKCALLPWMALQDAEAKAGIGTDQEGKRLSMATATEDDVIEAMKDVVDPELGINVVDLGLVYGVTVDDANIATVDMTLTSAACPLTDVIEDQTRSALTDVVSDFRINWVWMPPWGPDKITDDGREMLRALGFNV